MSDETIKGVIIRTTGHTEVTTIPRSGLKEMQAIVGGYIEGVTIDGGRMYVNEEGLIKGLAINAVASTFYPGPTPICGDVLVLGPCTPDGWDTSITPELQRRIDNVW